MLASLTRNEGNVYQTAKENGVPESTIHYWLRLPETSSDLPPASGTGLDERLEQIARQMVEAMPQRVDEASLQDLVRLLPIVLDTMNQARAGKEKNSNAREKLAEILDRYAAVENTEGASESADE